MHTVDHTDTIVDIRDVSFSYGETEILSHVNLSIHRGDYLALVGGNGAGKTTLLKIMLGLRTPTVGTVHMFGTPIESFHNWPKVGYVPQQATAFDTKFPATVEEVVRMGRYGRRGLFHRLTGEDRQKAHDALKQVGLLPLCDRLVGELSGGQQQRVFIARALASDPEIIFLDEPTVGVEKRVRDEFYMLLRTLNQEMRLTVVLVTHDIESIAHEAMHIACVDHTLFFHESVDQYFKETHRVTHPHA